MPSSETAVALVRPTTKPAGQGAPSAICRIVPIGQSLSFDAVWDGYDLLRDSVRLIRIM